MDAALIKTCIEENVYADHSGSLHGVDEVAEYLAARIKTLEDKIAKLTPKYSEPWEDRMGGQFTQEEIARSQRGGEGW